MTFVIRQLKHKCEAVSWDPGKFHNNAIQTTMNVVFTQMTCCANFLECEMWHKQFPSLTARCQWWYPGDNGLASCLMGQHPVPGLTTLWQLSRNKWGNYWSGNGAVEGAGCSMMIINPGRFTSKANKVKTVWSLWNIIISEWVVCYLCFVCCGWLVCFWWDFLVA